MLQLGAIYVDQVMECCRLARKLKA